MIDRAALVLLSPLLIVQALRVRSRMKPLPEALGPHSGTVGAGPPLRLLMIGDSSMAGVGAHHLDDALPGQVLKRLAPHHRVDWHMHARSSATTASTLHTLPPHPCDVAVVALGVNDLTRLVPIARWIERTEGLIDRLQECGARQVHLTALPPVYLFPALPQPTAWIMGARAARMNEALTVLALRREVILHTFPETQFTEDAAAEDGFHPSVQTYAHWAERVATKILSTPDNRRGG